jgi:hypothetical protein
VGPRAVLDAVVKRDLNIYTGHVGLLGHSIQGGFDGLDMYLGWVRREIRTDLLKNSNREDREGDGNIKN